MHNAFAPKEDSINVVKDWLVSSGIDSRWIAHSDSKGWLALNIPAEDAEKLFQTEYHEHEHTVTGSTRIGCDAYHVPAEIQRHIDYITPGVKFSAPVKKRITKRSEPSAGRRRSGLAKITVDHSLAPSSYYNTSQASYLPEILQDCGENITPACIKALYGIPPAHLNDSVNSLGIYEDGDYYAQEDLDLFFANYAPNVPNGTHPTPAFIDGASAPVPVNDSSNTGESDIDMDMSFSLIYPQTVTLYQTDDKIYATEELNGTFEGFLNTFLDALDGSYCNYTAYGITGDSPGLDPSYPDTNAGGYNGSATSPTIDLDSG